MKTPARYLPIDEVLRGHLSRALESCDIKVPAADVHIERTAKLELGDWFSNVALTEAKRAGHPPRTLADKLAGILMEAPPPHVDEVEVAGPGFLNFRLADSWLIEALEAILVQGTERYAHEDLGRGERVQIEFVSANPTGPLHVGNGWLCSYGDTLARLMERCGWKVEREYYVNDTGGQIRRLGESLLARCRGEEVADDGYQGEYVTVLAQRYPGPTDSGETSIVEAGRWAASEILGNIRSSMERLGIFFDEWFSQASIEEGGAVVETISALSTGGLVFEDDGATWLRSSELGDVRDRVMIKSNGDVTYLAGDIAYHRNKFQIRKFDRVIDVFGADHHGQVASLMAGIEALGISRDRLEVQLGQMVSLADGKMSKRAGNFVSLDSLLDDIGEDAFRLLSLSKSINESTTLDLEAVRRKSMDNPVYYVQYAHARIASIGRVAAEREVERVELGKADLALLEHERELDLMRCLTELPFVVAESCLRREPFKVTNWVRKAADRFHGFYHDCYVMGDDVSPDLTQARLWLVEGARIGLTIGLELLGVSAPESM